MKNTFFGGIHPNDRKAATASKATEIMPAPVEVIIPMSMHVGAPCSPEVAKGDKVMLGQRIGSAQAPVSAPIHASVSGTVKAVEPRLHPNGTKVMSVVIENDMQDTPDESVKPCQNPENLTPEEITAIIKEKGITGMGGAAFPTHFKISSGVGKVDTLIINGAECEPYITSDHRTMLEHPREVIEGVRLAIKASGTKGAIIAVENNKKDAVAALRAALSKEDSEYIEVRPLKVRYPQGSEKQLIQTVTGRQVPPGGLPASVGCSIMNIFTCYSIRRAVYEGMPAIERIVTISGSAINEPKNLLARVGTPVSRLFEACGGFKTAPDKILAGGPMMGVAQFSTEFPVVKATNALLALGKEENKNIEEPVCIRCGKCIGVCPMRLKPIFMYLYEQSSDLEALTELNVTDCIECGACAYVCPGRLHLVHSFRTAKQKLIDEKNAQKQKEGK